MRQITPHVVLFVLLAVLLLFAGCGGSEREYVLQAVPERPDLSGWPDRFFQRLENAEAQAINGTDPVSSLGDLARLYHANGFYDEASRCYQALMALEPRNPKWPHYLASILSGYGQLDDAIPLRARVTELAPDFVPGLIRYGDVLLKQNRFDKAAVYYERALVSDAANPYALLGLARIDVANGDLSPAEAKLRVATQNSEYRIGADLLVTVYERQGNSRSASAIRGQNKGSGSFSDIPDPWLFELYSDCFDTYQLAVAAGLANHRGDSASAIRILKRAIQMSSRDASLHFQLGLIYMNQGNATDAIGSFRDCVTLDPTFSDGWFHLAGIYESLGNANDQAKALAEGLFYNPDSPGLHLVNGRRLKVMGDTDAAIREMEKAVDLRPEEADPIADLAALYISVGQTEKGIDTMKRVLAIESLHPVALSTMAFYNISVANEAEARVYIDKIRMQPRIAPVQLENLIAKYRTQFGSAP